MTQEHMHDPEAERAVLAAVLLDNECFGRLGELAPADFFLPAHTVIFDAARTMRMRNELVDPITLVNELRRRERINTVGGAQFIQELTDQLPTVAHVEHYARIVMDRAAHRRALDAMRFASERLLLGEPYESVWQQLSKTFGTDHERMSGAQRVGQDMEDLFDTVTRRAEGKERPLQTPWNSFNQLLGGGLWPGMYVLVGSTGSGKSQWAVQTAVRAAQSGARVLYLALELSRRDLAARVMGVVADVPWSRLLRGTLSANEIHGAFSREHLVRSLPIFTECGIPFGYGVDTLLSRAWSLKPQVIVLDYLQLCGGRASEEPRITVGRVSYVARMLARDLGSVVLVLSSTARANYSDMVSDPDRDPTELVGMGKESGEIEYAADGVLVLARDARAPGSTRRVMVVAKNRYGDVGRIGLTWSGTTFGDELVSERSGNPRNDTREDDTGDPNGIMI